MTRRLLVFSDLDGTLLDHDTYDFSPALPALAALREAGAIVVLASSKTRDEMLELRRAMGHTGPFITENGGAVYVPKGALPQAPDAEEPEAVVLGVPYAEIRQVLQQLREEQGVDFVGFGDVDAKEVARWTGLSEDAAARARARASSEPLRFGGDVDALMHFAEALSAHGLQVQRGGRFFSVQGAVSKGLAAAHLLRRILRANPNLPLTTVAAGDADNDVPMFKVVDIPVLIPPKTDRKPVEFSHPNLIRAPEPGPAGWAAAIHQILAQGATPTD